MAEQTVRTFRRAFKYRVYPTKVQVQKLESWLSLCCELYNAALQERRDAWRMSGKSVGFYDQSKQLPAIKRERPEVADVNAQVLQQVLHRVDLAFKAFFRRVKSGDKPGYPRFKSRDRYDSVTWPQDICFRVNGVRRIKLSSIGDVPIKLHRPLQGIPKTCTIKRQGDNLWKNSSKEVAMAESAYMRYSKLYEEVAKLLPKGKKNLLKDLVIVHSEFENERLENRRKEMDENEKRITASREKERAELSKKEEDLNKKIEAFKRSDIQQKIGEGIETLLGVFAKAQMDAYFRERRGFF